MIKSPTYKTLYILTPILNNTGELSKEIIEARISGLYTYRYVFRLFNQEVECIYQNNDKHFKNDFHQFNLN